jgi:hypothetical protein
MTISHSGPHGMKSVWYKSCGENQNAHFVFSNLSLKIMQFVRELGKIF